MKRKIQYLLSIWILLCFGFHVNAQHKLIKKANDLYNQYAYAEAIKSYKKIIKKGNGTLETYKRLGDCYFYNSNLKDAARWYDRMWHRQKELEMEKRDSLQTQLEYKLDESLDIPVEYVFRTAQSYKFLKKYKKADSLIFTLKEQNLQDSRAVRFINQPDYLDQIEKQSGRYEIKNIPQNSLAVDFAPSFYLDKIVFSSSRINKISRARNNWTKQPYLDLYSYAYSENDSLPSYPFEFSKNINSRLHESTSVFSKDGKTIYFTRNNIRKSRIKKDTTGTSRLKIYRAHMDNNSQWSQIEELPFNNDQFSVAHPSLSEDGSKLYFVSDMPGGYGMSDIYVVDVNENGSFGTPKNLGPKINTEGRDTFPFITESGMLYFASDGHLGLGGLDIFVTSITDSNVIYNLGKPINSPADDISLIFNEETKKGFFASNRTGGRGADDIYEFTETKPLIVSCKTSLKTIVLDKKNNNPIPNANLQLKDENGKILFTGITNNQGEFISEINCNNKKYIITITKQDYESSTQNLQIIDTNKFPTKTIQLESNIDIPKKGIDLGKLLNLKPIYFASNKATILPKTVIELNKVVAYMKENKTIYIEVGSHTDSKGSDTYNLKLSKRRATSTANYIINQGINPSRVKSKGYGETRLINNCSNGVQCSKEEHAVNRRSEFIIIEN